MQKKRSPWKEERRATRREKEGKKKAIQREGKGGDRGRSAKGEERSQLKEKSDGRKGHCLEGSEEEEGRTKSNCLMVALLNPSLFPFRWPLCSTFPNVGPKPSPLFFLRVALLSSPVFPVGGVVPSSLILF